MTAKKKLTIQKAKKILSQYEILVLPKRAIKAKEWFSPEMFKGMTVKQIANHANMLLDMILYQGKLNFIDLKSKATRRRSHEFPISQDSRRSGGSRKKTTE